MYFRFGSAVALVVLVSLIGVAVEKRNLEYRRALSRQHYRLDVLLEAHAKLRLQTQQMGAPVNLIDALENGELELRRPEQAGDGSSTETATEQTRRMPLLRWQRGPLEAN